MDYTGIEQNKQLEDIKTRLRDTLGKSTDALIVIEEYDKLDCATRNFWRQILLNPEHAGIRFNR